jgi:hypothetical protein
VFHFSRFCPFSKIIASIYTPTIGVGEFWKVPPLPDIVFFILAMVLHCGFILIYILTILVDSVMVLHYGSFFNWPGMVAHACNPSTQEAHAGGLLLVPGQPGLHK